MKRHTPLTALESKVYTAIGRASMCWEDPKGAGVFDEKQANEVAAELCAYIVMNTSPKPRNVWGRLWEYLKSVVRGAVIYLPHYLISAFFIWSAFYLICEGAVVTYWQAFGMFWLIRIIAVYIVQLPKDKHLRKEEIKNKLITKYKS